MEERDGVTTTSFRVMVRETEPYIFQTCAAQQVQSSVRITHITFTPPTDDEAEVYLRHQCKTAAAATLGTNCTNVCPVTVARIRTLCASGKLESHAVACFPWGRSGADEGAADCDDTAAGRVTGGRGKKSGRCLKQTPPPAAIPPVERVRLAGFFEVPLPRHTDICGNVDLRLDVDGSVCLEVDGPGSVTFFGEQHSALVPEWLNHRFFTVGDDDEEECDNEEDEDEEDNDDVTTMYGFFS